MRYTPTSRRLVVVMAVLFAALVIAWRSDAILHAAPAAGHADLQSTPGAVATPESQQRGGEPLPPVRGYRFDGDVRRLPPVPALPLAAGINEQEVLPSRPAAQGPALPDAPVAPNMPVASNNFAGLSFDSSCTGGQCGAGWPPDPVGDVGLNHYVEAINTSVGIFDKTGVRLAAFTLNSLWSTAHSGTACDNANQGDPLVVYDPLADRWIIADMAFASISAAPYYECFAVSMTGNPVSGGWYLLALRTDDAAHPYLNDYAKMGVWPDGIYMTANEFEKGSTFRGVRVWAIHRAQLEAGLLRAQVFDLGTSAYSLLPANLRGIVPPTAAPEYLVAEDLTAYKYDVYTLKVDWNAPANSLLSGPSKVSQASYSTPSANIVPQPNTNTKLDSLGDRLMMQLQYRNINGSESLWVAHTVRPSSSAPTGIQWAQLSVTAGVIAASPAQEQIFTNGGDGLYRWMPSIASDRMGNAAVGYSTSSSTAYPSIEYAGRLAGDPVNTLGQGRMVLFGGTGSQKFNCGSGPCSRWGDYTAMTVDPVDDCTFWYVNEYYVTTGSTAWSTRIGSFKYPSCPPAPASITDLKIATDGSNAKLSWTNPAVNDSTRILSSNTDPYFAPGSGTDRGTLRVPIATWPDVGVIGGTANTVYYVVLGQVAGVNAGPSNTVGLFEFGLAPGQ